MKGQFYSYLLRCGDGSLYCGWTSDPQRRLEAHNAGRGAKYTRSRRPVELAGLWSWPSRRAAMKAERYIKGLSRERKEALLLSRLILVWEDDRIARSQPEKRP